MIRTNSVHRLPDAFACYGRPDRVRAQTSGKERAMPEDFGLRHFTYVRPKVESVCLVVLLDTEHVLSSGLLVPVQPSATYAVNPSRLT